MTVSEVKGERKIVNEKSWVDAIDMLWHVRCFMDENCSIEEDYISDKQKHLIEDLLDELSFFAYVNE